LVGVYMGTLSMPIDKDAETPKCSPGTSNTVSPFDISPVSNIKKRTTTRGRKAIRSSLITGSPYKDQLTKSLERSAPKKTSLSVPGEIVAWCRIRTVWHPLLWPQELHLLIREEFLGDPRCMRWGRILMENIITI
ncbi:hypothetical protein AVEN_47313-1, partial [Araneus ventricosus]